MRPNANLDIPVSRPRKHSDASDRPHLTPTTFFLTRDPDLRSNTPTNSSVQIDTSPVRSLKETLEEADQQHKHALPRFRQPDLHGGNRRRSTIRPQVIEETSSTTDGTSQTQPGLHTSVGATSLMAMGSREPSLPSSPKSMSSRSVARSDDELTQDDAESQAIASSEDERDDTLPNEVQDSVPQLIMPSIRMPSRRPFTDRGKQLGRFKILVAGSKGSGRTSLIKSIVQLCEDIVHVDSMPSATKSVAHDQGLGIHTRPITNEIYASTKPYPFWWSDLDESRVLKRRKSVGDAVLERNICFVDTNNAGRSNNVVQYLEQQLVSSLNVIQQKGHELSGLLSGRGGQQVDVVLYLLTKDTLREDCSAVRRIGQLCNVIPLIAKADLLPAEIICELKATELQGIALPRLPFDNSGDHLSQAPYCVSSANGTDFDNMDASLLMSPEYVRPLVSSELSLLIQQLFEPSTVSYLRHTSAKKLVSWQAAESRLTQVSSPSIRSTQPSTLNSPLPTSLSNSGVLVPVTSNLSLNTSNSYALARIADHTQREEHLAQIRLSKWASDLQLSLQRERERYENLAQKERALWLVQRMGEEIRDGQVLHQQDTQALVKANGQSRMIHPEIVYDAHDPLGLLQWQNTARTRGWAALQIIGSFGVVGGVALWLAKTWGLTLSLHEWAQDWAAHLFGTTE